MRHFILPIMTMMVLAGANAALADDDKKMVEGTVVTLSAADSKKVEQDLLVASLRIELDNKDPRALQNDINKAMKKAVEMAKSVPELKVSTGNYNVYSYDPNPIPKTLTMEERKARMMWKGSQAINIESKDSQKLLDVVGKIQDAGFAMNGLNYTLSDELAEAQKDALLVGALQKIKAKAELVTKTLGKSGYDIVEVNVDNSYMPQPQPVMMRAMAMADSGMEKMSAPVASAGESDVSMSVSARVVLKP